MKILVWVGAINWGLIGLDGLLGGSWYFVNLNTLLGGIPWLENTIYLLVGVSAIILCIGCGGKCNKMNKKMCCPGDKTCEDCEPKEA